MTESKYSKKRRMIRSAPGAAAATFVLLFFVLLTSRVNRAQDAKKGGAPQIDFRQTQAEADTKSTGCVSCHGMTEAATMHPTATIRIGCADCHGGDSNVMKPAGVEADAKAYTNAKLQAHPKPTVPSLWKNSGNPVRAQTDWCRSRLRCFASHC